MARPQDEIDDTLAGGPDEQTLSETGQQDFTLRNAQMSNALPATAQPAAGAVIGSGGDLGMDPNTDEEEVDTATGDPRTDPRRE